MSFSNISPPTYDIFADVPRLAHYSSPGSTPDVKEPPEIDSLVLGNQPLKLQLDTSTVNGRILIGRLCEYMLLLRDMEDRRSRAETKYHELEKSTRMELEALTKEVQCLRDACKKSEAETSVLRNELLQLKETLNAKQRLEKTEERAQPTNDMDKPAIDVEYKPVYRSPEEMMKTRFDILARLPVPKDTLVDVLMPLGIPERFTLHEFLLGSASGSLRNALSGYCAFTENTTMWCPEREEHGFYLTPLYKCDTDPRYNVTHRWVKVDIKARMPRPTECFYRKDSEWYYTGTYQSWRLEDLTPEEYDNLSQPTRDALVKETLAGRKNTTPQVLFETSQLYATGALKVAVVGIRCVGFNRMLYSVALQQAQRFKTGGRRNISAGNTSTL